MKKLSLILIMCVVLTTLVPFTTSALTYGDWEYTVSNGEVTIAKYIGYDTDVTIPATIDGLPVTKIGDRAFWDYRSLISVIIPNGVTLIGSYAFSNCVKLISVAIPNSVISIGGNAFSYCYSLTNVNIPENMASIGEYAFIYCYGLTTITIPNSVVDIGSYAFARCGLTSVAIPDSVIHIGIAAFWECSSLTATTIGNNVTYIGNGAFSNCSSLASVTIPYSVTSVGSSAFESCCKLKTAYFKHSDASKITAFGQNVFYDTAPDFKIIYPANATGFTTPTWKGCPAYPDDGSIAIPSAITGVTLNKTTATIELGRNEPLTATISPANAANKNISWSSSNPNVAVVVGDGIVVPLAKGTAVITARTADGGFTASCTVTVVEAKPEHIPGDINGDGKVNIADLIRLAQWLAEINTTPLGEP